MTTDYVNNNDLTSAIVAYQANPTPETANIIYKAVHAIADGYWARYTRGPWQPDERTEFAQECVIQAIKWSGKFQPGKGKAFNYLTTCIQNRHRQVTRAEQNRKGILDKYKQFKRDTR